MSYCVFEIISWFQHPHASDTDLMHCGGQNHCDPILWCPVHSRLLKSTIVYPVDVGLGKGILVFHGQVVHDMFHLCLFIDTDPHCQIVVQVVQLGKIWVGIKLDSSKNTSPISNYSSIISVCWQGFCCLRNPSRCDCYVCYHLDCATCPGPYEWQQ